MAPAVESRSHGLSLGQYVSEITVDLHGNVGTGPDRQAPGLVSLKVSTPLQRSTMKGMTEKIRVFGAQSARQKERISTPSVLCPQWGLYKRAFHKNQKDRHHVSTLFR